MATCRAAFYFAFVNLALYGLVCLRVLWPNWDKFSWKVLFLILAPLYAMLFTCFWVFYYWYDQGKRATCVAYGSETELISRDSEDAMLFLVQSIFVFTMRKILARISAPSKVDGVIRATRYHRFMIAYIILFILYVVGLGLIKGYIFRRPSASLNNETTGLEMAFLCLEACRLFFNGTILVLFIRGIQLYISQIKAVTS